MGRLLSEAEIEDGLSDLQGWEQDDSGKAISKRFSFKTFNQAFAFMTRCALAAEKMDHHPDWSNCYNTVNVSLSTHDAGGLTDKDISLARKMNNFAGSF